LVAAGIVFFTVLLSFSPAFRAGFVDWDDVDLLVKNTRYQTLTSENFNWMFSTWFAGHYQPLTWLSFWLDFKLWGGGPAGFHATNVLFHAASAVLWLFVSRGLLVRVAASNGAEPRNNLTLAAGIAALLFAVHPLRVESVAWLAERRDVLSGGLFMACVLCYLRAVGSSAAREGTELTEATNLKWYLLSFVFYGLSLSAKAGAMTAVAVLVILDIYPLRRLGGRTGWWNSSVRRVWIEKIPFAVLGGVAAYVALIAQEKGGALLTLAEHDWPARWSQAVFGIVFYVWKSILPTQLGPIYQIPPRGEALGPRIWICAALVIASLVALYRCRRRAPGLAAATAAYIVLILPVLGFAQSGPQLVADRYSYLSCLGLTLLPAWWVTRNAPVQSVGGKSRSRSVVPILCLIWVGVLATATFMQTTHWNNALDLWELGVRVSPHSPVARANLADALARNGRFEAAEPHYLRALELNPQDAVALNHWGDLCRATHRPDDALDAYQSALSVNPKRWRAALSMAEILADRGQAAEALPVLRAAASQNMEATELLDFFTQLLATHPDARVRDGSEAVVWAEKLCDALPADDLTCPLNLSTALAEAGRFDEAARFGEIGLQLARRSGNARLEKEFERRLLRFRDGRPYAAPDP